MSKSGNRIRLPESAKTESVFPGKPGLSEKVGSSGKSEFPEKPEFAEKKEFSGNPEF